MVHSINHTKWHGTMPCISSEWSSEKENTQQDHNEHTVSRPLTA